MAVKDKTPPPTPEIAGKAPVKAGLPETTAAELVDDLPSVSTAPQGKTVKLSDIRKCGLDFFSDDESAAFLGMHIDVWRKLLKDRRVSAALDEGRAYGRALLKIQTRKLWQIHGTAGVKMMVHMREQQFGEVPHRPGAANAPAAPPPGAEARRVTLNVHFGAPPAPPVAAKPALAVVDGSKGKVA
jgi:hypothetical protein